MKILKALLSIFVVAATTAGASAPVPPRIVGGSCSTVSPSYVLGCCKTKELKNETDAYCDQWKVPGALCVFAGGPTFDLCCFDKKQNNEFDPACYASLLSPAPAPEPTPSLAPSPSPRPSPESHHTTPSTKYHHPPPSPRGQSPSPSAVPSSSDSVNDSVREPEISRQDEISVPIHSGSRSIRINIAVFASAAFVFLFAL